MYYWLNLITTFTSRRHLNWWRMQGGSSPNGQPFQVCDVFLNSYICWFVLRFAFFVKNKVSLSQKLNTYNWQGYPEWAVPAGPRVLGHIFHGPQSHRTQPGSSAAAQVARPMWSPLSFWPFWSSMQSLPFGRRAGAMLTHADPLVLSAMFQWRSALHLVNLRDLGGTAQDSKAEKALDALKKLAPECAMVLRNGSWQSTLDRARSAGRFFLRKKNIRQTNIDIERKEIPVWKTIYRWRLFHNYLILFMFV